MNARQPLASNMILLLLNILILDMRQFIAMKLNRLRQFISHLIELKERTARGNCTPTSPREAEGSSSRVPSRLGGRGKAQRAPVVAPGRAALCPGHPTSELHGRVSLSWIA